MALSERGVGVRVGGCVRIAVGGGGVWRRGRAFCLGEGWAAPLG